MEQQRDQLWLEWISVNALLRNENDYIYLCWSGREFTLHLRIIYPSPIGIGRALWNTWPLSTDRKVKPREGQRLAQDHSAVAALTAAQRLFQGHGLSVTHEGLERISYLRRGVFFVIIL